LENHRDWFDAGSINPAAGHEPRATAHEVEMTMRDAGLRMVSSLPVMSRRELLRGAAGVGLMAASAMSPLKDLVANSCNKLCAYLPATAL
jgi:hypothetical protein